MALLNISQAAKAAGVSRNTIYKKVRKGILSANVSDDGTKKIDTSELIRVATCKHNPSSLQTS